MVFNQRGVLWLKFQPQDPPVAKVMVEGHRNLPPLRRSDDITILRVAIYLGTENLEIFESKPYFSRLIKENSDTMLVISKMNMNAIRVNASVQLLTKQSSVSSNFRC